MLRLSAAYRWIAGAAILVSVFVTGAVAQELVAVRVGRHAGFDRIVLEWSELPWYFAKQQGADAVIRFATPLGADAGRIGSLGNLGRVTHVGTTLGLTLRPGVILRHYRLDNRVVLDLLDPRRGPGRESVKTPNLEMDLAVVGDAARARGPENGRRTRNRRLRTDPGNLERLGPESSAPVRTPAAQVMEDARPAGAVASAQVAITPPDSSHPPTSIVIPAPNHTNVAVLRRGTNLVVALDARAPFDFSDLTRSPEFAHAAIEVRPEGAVIVLPVDAQAKPRLRRDTKGFVLTMHEPAEGIQSSLEPKPDLAASRLLLPLLQAGRVMPVQDPITGLPMFLVTSGRFEQAVSGERRLPELDLLPTVSGIAILARSDRVSVRSQADAVAIQLGLERLALESGEGPTSSGPAMSLSFTFPKQPIPSMVERLKALQTSISNASPLARMAERQAAAEVMLSLGMPQEAQALLVIGFTEDPRAGRDPKYRALFSVAALLGGRPGEASGLSSPGLPETDEIRFWRAVLASELGDRISVAPSLRTTLPLLLGYPPPLRRRLLPIVGQAFADAGDRDGLRALLESSPNEPGLALLRVMLDEFDGRTDAALAGFAALSNGTDRELRARALRRMAELRLARGELTPLTAAEDLERSLYAWRGSDEVALRVRIAELLSQAGAARRAFAMLQETTAIFTEELARMRPLLMDAFAASLETEPPLAAIGLFDAHPHLLPSSVRGDMALATLAERLAELDLTDRATALLRPLVAKTQGERRAQLGLRLAGLRLGEGDTADAERILADTAMSDPPVPLGLDRALLAARIEGRRGRPAEGVAMLRGFGTAAAIGVAELLTESRDWAGAAAALAERRAELPAAATSLSEGEQRLAVREAVLLALAGDSARLAALGQVMAGRLTDKALASAFQLVVDTPLQGLAALPRLQRDLRIFDRLPVQPEAIRRADAATPSASR